MEQDNRYQVEEAALENVAGGGRGDGAECEQKDIHTREPGEGEKSSQDDWSYVINEPKLFQDLSQLSSKS